MNFNELQILPPKYWQQFEDLCLSVFRIVWSDPTAQKNGRSGQPQWGTDISGYHSGALCGVQCKGKDIAYGSQLTEQDLRDEVAKARGFKPPLSHWILATTAPKDAQLEELARSITTEHGASGLFRVQVLGWEDLQSLIATQSSVIRLHYPDFAPIVSAPVETNDRALGTTPIDLSSHITAARSASTQDLELFQKAVGGQKSVLLNLKWDIEGKAQPTTHAEVIVALQSGKSLLLKSEPGSGKSTFLTQLAASILAQSDDRISAILPLPELAHGQRGVIEEIANRSSFSTLGSEMLKLLAGAGKLVVLCDGWNELSTDQRHPVQVGLAKFQREFPKCGLLVATRGFSASPIRQSAAVYLSPATQTQQLEILTLRVGPAAQRLLTEARRTRGFRDLLGTPLYLDILADIGSSGVVPGTKEEAIRRFIEIQENRPEHSFALRRDLGDCHGHYLRGIARQMTVVGVAAFTQNVLRSEISTISERLATDGQIAPKPNPQDVIDVLVSHHVLVERGRDSVGRLYSYQHQQFQEWFASFSVEETIKSHSTFPTPENTLALLGILNRVEWTESILFAVERLSHTPPDGATLVGTAILRAITIDPLLAATMIRCASDEAWTCIADPVIRFAGDWYKTEEKDRAFRFMTITGRHEFAKWIWETIEKKDEYERIEPVRTNVMSPSVLGQAAQLRYAKLPPEQRRTLLWDLTYHGNQEGVEFAIEACRTETSAEIVETVVDALLFMHAETELTILAKAASQAVWSQLASHIHLSDASGEFRAKLSDEKKKRAAATEGFERLRMLMELSDAGEYGNPEEVVTLALDTKYHNYHAELETLEQLAAYDPERLSAAILDRILNSKIPSSVTVKFVRLAKPEQQETLRAIALGKLPRNGRAKEIAARALDAQSVGMLISELLAALDEIQANDASRTESRRNWIWTITVALNLVKPDILTSCLLAVGHKETHHIGALAELLFRMESDNSAHETLAIDEGTSVALCAMVDQWVEILTLSSQATRDAYSNVATAIKRLGNPTLLSSLKKLLDVELEAWRRERLEFERIRKEGRHVALTNMVYTNLYRQAFEALVGEPVRDVLVEYIGNPDFEVEAGGALVRYGTSRPLPSHASVFGNSKFNQLTSARANRNYESIPTHSICEPILNRVEELLATGGANDLQRAIGLATSAAQMDYGHRLQSIAAVLDSPGPMLPRYGLILSLVYAGESISAAWVQRGFDEAIGAAKKGYGSRQDDWWQVERFIELMAFTESPEAILDQMAALPHEFKWGHNFRDILTALGLAGTQGALTTLIELPRRVPGLETIHEYVNALELHDSPEAREYLQSLALASPFPPGAPYHLCEALRRLLRRDSLAKRTFLDKITAAPRANQDGLLRVVSSIIDQHDVLRILQLCDPGTDMPLVQAMGHAVERLSVLERSIEGTSAYEIEPSDLSKIRAELFQIYLAQGSHAAIAMRLLSTIDRSRDSHGRPLSEPRHPNLESGALWPAAAATILSHLDAASATNTERPR